MNPFVSVTPTTAQKSELDYLTSCFIHTYEAISNQPASPERSIALIRLKEASMWANVAALGIRIECTIE